MKFFKWFIRYRIVKETTIGVDIKYYPEEMFILIPIWCRFTNSFTEDEIFFFNTYEDALEFVNKRKCCVKKHKLIIKKEIYRVDL